MGLSEAITSINTAVVSPGKFSEEERREAVSACERLRASLETPIEGVIRRLFTTQDAIALRLGVDMKLFDAAVKASSSGDEIQIGELSSEVSADPLLVSRCWTKCLYEQNLTLSARIMRLLVGIGIFKENTKDSFSSTDLTGAYATGSVAATGAIHTAELIRTFAGFPDYFEKNGFQNPNDAYNAPFQYAYGTKLHYFDYLATRPRIGQALNTMLNMSTTRSGLQWFEYFPVEAKLHVKSSSAPLLVDVGGGHGQDLIELKQRHPALPGRLILQDQSHVIDEITELPSGIETMSHDFFALQPVPGAKAYLLRCVLQDWLDQHARQILSRIKDAMTPESLLLICEVVLPESNVGLLPARIDVLMMGLLAGVDRTRKQFETLLNDVGLELVHIWTSDHAPPTSDPSKLVEQSALIEAVLKK
ncbi:hypothetical protein MMC07_000091 [Pseudocyphellaria aurata]|nr:hypothetical protein [Pseudocyphellaria aurata]